MSELRPGDQRLHYSDNSHRWIAPGNVDQTAWDAGLHAHLALHLATMGGPVAADTEPRPAERRRGLARRTRPERRAA
jgi:hypothetical protein